MKIIPQHCLMGMFYCPTNLLTRAQSRSAKSWPLWPTVRSKRRYSHPSPSQACFRSPCKLKTRKRWIWQAGWGMPDAGCHTCWLINSPALQRWRKYPCPTLVKENSLRLPWRLPCHCESGCNVFILLAFCFVLMSNQWYHLIGFEKFDRKKIRLKVSFFATLLMSFTQKWKQR